MEAVFVVNRVHLLSVLLDLVHNTYGTRSLARDWR